MNANCPPDDELLSLIEGTLAAGALQQVDEHLQACDACQERLDQLTTVPLSLVRRAPEDGLSDQTVSAMVGRIRKSAMPSRGGYVSDDAQQLAEQVVSQLRHYEAGDLIGFGGSGALLKAVDRRDGREVAIKVWPAAASASPEHRERSEREAESLARLNHPFVVRILDSGRTEDGASYLVMEYVEGRPLSSWIRQHGPMPPRRAATVVRDVSQALAAAHDAGLIHRDVKPSNILIDTDRETIKLVDFGLVLDQQSDSQLTQEGAFAGTPHYMSPEQIRDPHGVDFRSDVYSLGIVLYELLTGVRPFQGIMRMVLSQAINDDVTEPRKLDDSIPYELETICLKAIAKEPSQRYHSATSFSDDLQRWLEGHVIRARRPSMMTRAVLWSRRNPTTAVLIGSLALLLTILAVGGSFMSWRLSNARNLADQRRRESQFQGRMLLDTLRTMIFEVPERLYSDDDVFLEDSERAVLEASLNGLAQLPGESRSQLGVMEAVAAAHARLALICFNLEEPDEAARHAKKAKSIVDEAGQLTDLTMPLLEAQSNANWTLGYLAWEAEQCEQAKGWLTKAVEIDERMLAVDPEHDSAHFDIARGYQDLAEITFELEKWQEAEQLLKRSSQIAAHAKATEDASDYESYQPDESDSKDDSISWDECGLSIANSLLLARIKLAQGNHEAAEASALLAWEEIDNSTYAGLPGDVFGTVEELTTIFTTVADHNQSAELGQQRIRDGIELLRRLSKEEQQYLVDTFDDTLATDEVDEIVSRLQAQLDQSTTERATAPE